MSQTFNTVRKFGSRVAAGATGLMLTGAAMAQSTDPFEVAVTEVTGKVETYGAALVGVAAVAVVFFVAIKYVKKISKAA